MTKPISEKTIREENYQTAYYTLENILKEIPMTERQRNEVRRSLNEIGEMFREANE
jgi:CRISPR/Cas system-associated exonuclease Cas4 (RecB family)